MLELKKGQILTSLVSRKRYRIGEVLGQGGFGRAYRAEELNRRNKPIEEVCLKTTLDQTSWHRESYFGELLSRTRRAIQTLDSFPVAPRSSRGRMAFCLVLELAEHGTIADYLGKTGRPWKPERAKREIVALLKMLDGLHGASATHRDITPMNIFVCGNGTLKLGDFGIARHQLAGQPMTIDAFNPAFVTQGFVEETHRYWAAVDDVYQMGQLLAMLLAGDAETIFNATAVNKLDCDAELKGIIKRAIGPRGKRYTDAYELRRALDGEEEPAATRLRSLRGKTVVFTGPLSMKRFDAGLLVLQSGGAVAKEVSKKVDVIIQGGRSPHYRGGHKGRKLQQAEDLIRQGFKIHIIGEAQFRKLVREEE